MIAGEEAISALWDRMREYVDAYVSEYDSLAVATVALRGQVRPDGTTIVVSEDGTISVSGGGSGYVLPEATESSLGGVKPDGTTITVDMDGTIHAAAGEARTGPYMDVRTDSSGNRRLAIVIPEGWDG